MFKFRKSVALALTTVVAASTVLSASASSTTKSLSSNFTLVNLDNASNTGTISYIDEAGGEWRDPETITLAALGDQLIRRQYDDPLLQPGSGSVVVSTAGPVGAVVQIQARAPQAPTFGAYVGVSAGATSASLPLVQRQRQTASGVSNSQIIVQNASTTPIDIEIVLTPGESTFSGFTKTFTGIAANASIEYDLADEASSNVADGFYGSATIRSTTSGGEVAVVSNLFNGADTMQTFNAFTESKTRWGVPLFASKLDNSLSTPVAVQNVGTAQIPANSVTMTCVKDVNAPGPATLSFPNDTAIAPQASFFFNPVTNAAMPEDWYGACTVDSGTFQTAVFVQLRTVAGSRAGAHEGIPMDSTDKVAVIPLYAKRLTNGFASAITILNLSSSATANVTLAYKGGAGTAANCSANLSRQIPAGGSLIQNHRVPNGVAGSVDELGDNCFGTLTITSSDQPVDAFAQLDLLDTLLDPDPGGDPFQAHNAFTIE